MKHVLLLIAVVILLSGCGGGGGGENNLVTEVQVESPSVLSGGNISRIKSVMDKAERGETITVGYLGGSITRGVGASSYEKSYASHITSWFRTKYQKANIVEINAGIDSTGSIYGALRVERDILTYHPDLVIIEYAVNDIGVQGADEALEGIVRQVLSQDNNPAVLLLFMARSDGESAQDGLAPIGYYYSLPMISYGDAISGQIETGKLTWDEVTIDGVHPTDLGHSLVAGYVTDYLNHVMEMPSPTSVNTIPYPYLSDRYEHTQLYQGIDLQPVAYSGFVCGDSCDGDSPGDYIDINTQGSGTGIVLIYYSADGPMGIVSVDVDGEELVEVDGWCPCRNISASMIDGLEGKEHTIHIEITNESSSDGHRFRLYAIGEIGL